MATSLVPEKVKVLIKEPGKPAKVEEIGTDLKDYQTIVCGYIESLPFPGSDTMDFIINDMGKMDGSERNIAVPEYGDVLFGTIIVIGVDPTSCLWRSLTDEELKTAQKYLQEHNIEPSFVKETEEFTQIKALQTAKKTYELLKQYPSVYSEIEQQLNELGYSLQMLKEIWK